MTRNAPPKHYAGAIEPWDYIKAHGLDFWSANVIKYVTRAGRKDGASRLDDYRKAQNYLTFLIAEEEAAARRLADEEAAAAAVEGMTPPVCHCDAAEPGQHWHGEEAPPELDESVWERHFTEWAGHQLGPPNRCRVCLERART